MLLVECNRLYSWPCRAPGQASMWLQYMIPCYPHPGRNHAQECTFALTSKELLAQYVGLNPRTRRAHGQASMRRKPHLFLEELHAYQICSRIMPDRFIQPTKDFSSSLVHRAEWMNSKLNRGFGLLVQSSC
jgi:hypothetical protein